MSRLDRHTVRERGRFAAALFAATFVFTVGGGICLAITYAFAPDVLWVAISAIGGGIIGLRGLMWLLSESSVHRAKDSNIYAAQKQTLSEYVESFRPDLRHGRKSRHFGTNQPPTADGVRQIKDDSNAWYPSERRVEEYRKTLDDNAH